MRSPLLQALERAPGLRNGGLNEVKALYTRFTEERVTDLLTIQSDHDIVKAVRRLQGVKDFLDFLEVSVKDDEE